MTFLQPGTVVPQDCDILVQYYAGQHTTIEIALLTFVFFRVTGRSFWLPIRPKSITWGRAQDCCHPSAPLGTACTTWPRGRRQRARRLSWDSMERTTQAAQHIARFGSAPGRRLASRRATRGGRVENA